MCILSGIGQVLPALSPLCQAKKEVEFRFSPSIFNILVGTAAASVPFTNADIWLHHLHQLLRLTLSYSWRSIKIPTESVWLSLS